MRKISAAEIKRIHFIEYNAKMSTLGSLNPMFPKYGNTLLSSLLRDMGYDVTVYLEPRLRNRELCGERNGHGEL
jgi:hypothetical protein